MNITTRLSFFTAVVSAAITPPAYTMSNSESPGVTPTRRSLPLDFRLTASAGSAVDAYRTPQIADTHLTHMFLRDDVCLRRSYCPPDHHVHTVYKKLEVMENLLAHGPIGAKERDTLMKNVALLERELPAHLKAQRRRQMPVDEGITSQQDAREEQKAIVEIVRASIRNEVARLRRKMEEINRAWPEPPAPETCTGDESVTRPVPPPLATVPSRLTNRRNAICADDPVITKLRSQGTPQ